MFQAQRSAAVDMLVGADPRDISTSQELGQLGPSTLTAAWQSQVRVAGHHMYIQLFFSHSNVKFGLGALQLLPKEITS
jgi:hypothetical protein